MCVLPRLVGCVAPCAALQTKIQPYVLPHRDLRAVRTTLRLSSSVTYILQYQFNPQLNRLIQSCPSPRPREISLGCVYLWSQIHPNFTPLDSCSSSVLATQHGPNLKICYRCCRSMTSKAAGPLKFTGRTCVPESAAPRRNMSRSLNLPPYLRPRCR